MRVELTCENCKAVMGFFTPFNDLNVDMDVLEISCVSCQTFRRLDDGRQA